MLNKLSWLGVLSVALCSSFSSRPAMAACPGPGGEEFFLGDIIRSARGPGDPRVAAARTAVQRASIEVAFKLLPQIKPVDGNYTISGMGLRDALLLLLNGIPDKSPAAQEIHALLGFNPNLGLGLINSSYANLSRMLQDTNDLMKLSVANGVFVDNEIGLLPEYATRMNESYGAEVQSLDLSKDGARVINGWVEQKTDGMIKKLLEDADLAWVLVNALFMKADWLAKFDKELTTPRSFRTLEDKQVDVWTMRSKGYQLYSEVNGNRMVSIPVVGNLAYLDVILPKTTLTEKNLTKVLTEETNADAYQALLNGAESSVVQLHLPRFAIKTGVMDLTGVLRKMLPAVFSNIDLSRMFSGKDAAVPPDGVVQNVVANVNEKGIEFAAATAIRRTRGVGPRLPGTPVEFDVNRAFIALIRHTQSSQVLGTTVVGLPKSDQDAESGPSQRPKL